MMRHVFVLAIVFFMIGMLHSFAGCTSSTPRQVGSTGADEDVTDYIDSNSDNPSADRDIEPSFPSWESLGDDRCLEGAQWGCLNQMYKAPCDDMSANSAVLCMEGCQMGQCLEDIYPISADQLEDNIKKLDLSEDRYVEPRISGDYMVVARGVQYEHYLVVYKVSTGEFVATLATDGTAEIGDYDISGEFVVWTDRRNNYHPSIPDSSPFFNTDIFMYDILREKTYQITTDPNKQNHVRIWGNYVIWEDYRSFDRKDVDAGQVEIWMLNLINGEKKRIIGIPSTIKASVGGDAKVDVTRINARIFNIANWFISGTIEYEKEGFDIPSDIFWYDIRKGEFRQLFIPMQQRNPFVIGYDVYWFGTWDIGEKSYVTDRQTLDTPSALNWDVFPDDGRDVSFVYFAKLEPPSEGNTKSRLLVYSMSNNTAKAIYEEEGIHLGNATANTLVFTLPAAHGNTEVYVAQWNQCANGDVCSRQFPNPVLGTCDTYTKECRGENSCQQGSCDPSIGCMYSMSSDPNCDDGNPETEADTCREGSVGEFICRGSLAADYDCPGHPEMVRYEKGGKSFCIDKYEAVLYDSADCTGNRYGVPDVSDESGSNADDYPEGFPNLVGDASVGAPFGDTTTPQSVALYACSKQGELPSAYLTWYQAKQACENVGKRLCTRSELVFVCSNKNTTDFPYITSSITGDDPTWCNGMYQNNPPMEPVATGEYESCKNLAFVADLSGNLAEWTGDDPVDCGDGKCAVLYGGAYNSPPSIMYCNDSNLLFYAPPSKQFVTTGTRCCLDVE